ncbi:ABC transporter ATP-binding protein [Candidatus Woesebacteria bacterium]|nr:ABC transporter ATP-binding protein [Candidatus Woesebacteria bacterium]
MKKSKSIVIDAKNISKKYLLRHEKPTFVENLLYKSKTEYHTALDDVTLSIFKGDRLGIIGKNGSGKTTLLKLFSGITRQQTGKLSIHGKVVSLIDLEAGFHPDLSGEDNIFLQGLILGMSVNELSEKKSEIIQFAEIGKFIDAPVYTYSSGMKLRLGFSIAIHSNPDILLLDENFAVGDEAFRNKIRIKFKEFRKNNITLILVSHWIEELEKSCNKFLWLDNGRVVAYGGKKVIEKYKKSFLNK